VFVFLFWSPLGGVLNVAVPSDLWSLGVAVQPLMVGGMWMALVPCACGSALNLLHASGRAPRAVSNLWLVLVFER
jgi:hypothetical protein